LVAVKYLKNIHSQRGGLGFFKLFRFTPQDPLFEFNKVTAAPENIERVELAV
jgi:hypothetical protein